MVICYHNINSISDDIASECDVPEDGDYDKLMDNIMGCIYEFIDRNVIYYEDCMNIIKEFNAYEGWQSYEFLEDTKIDNIMEVAYAVLYDYFMEVDLAGIVYDKIKAI